ncbi:hypothetical protein LJC58_04485 [Lachnospiraceae bacterium OttesenSCG-928-D06]|nr:hypothetical protein [Lachnospiraceae bacterium OttesenSCG-928-D06]
MNEDERRALQKKLEEQHQSGIELFLDGHKSSPEAVFSACVRENTVYMPDYVLGHDGELLQLWFDKVKA